MKVVPFLFYKYFELEKVAALIKQSSELFAAGENQSVCKALSQRAGEIHTIRFR